MTDQTPSGPQDPNAPQPGWYPDSADQTLLRWWDGTAWTAQTQPMPGTSVPQPPWPGTQPGPVQPSGHGRKSWPARHKALAGIIAFAALIIIASVAAGASGNGDTAATAPQSAAGPASASASATAPQAPASSAAPPPSPSGPAPATKVKFIVSGYAPDGVDITYGPSGTNLSGPTTLSGTAKMSVPFDPSASYYSLSAQLQGSGHITCKIVAEGPGDAPLTVSHGAASGGYNICSAQATTSDGLSWQDEN